MTDPQIQRDDDGPHEGPIRTPKQLILAVAYAFVAPILIIVLLVVYVTSDHRPAAGSNAFDADTVARRIAPVGAVQVKDAADLSTLKSGEAVFTAQCATCHAAGLLGAPKFGDAGAWAPRIKSGYEALLGSALHGKGQMPAQGGGDFTDLEVGRAVVYMANQGGAHFDEPAAPAANAMAGDGPGGASSGASALAPAAPTPPVASADATPAPAAIAPPVAAPATPSATVVANATATANTPATAPALYTQVCQACHASGVAGAPKFGDKAAWAPRLAEGIDGLTASAIHGKGVMPPRGGAATASDADVKSVVTYMVNAVK